MAADILDCNFFKTLLERVALFTTEGFIYKLLLLQCLQLLECVSYVKNEV